MVEARGDRMCRPAVAGRGGAAIRQARRFHSAHREGSVGKIERAGDDQEPEVRDAAAAARYDRRHRDWKSRYRVGSGHGHASADVAAVVAESYPLDRSEIAGAYTESARKNTGVDEVRRQFSAAGARGEHQAYRRRR